MEIRFAILAAVASVALAASAPAAAIGGGGYSENFDTLGTNGSGTALPDGYSVLGLAGAKTTYVAATPVTATNVAGAAGGTQTIFTVWNTGDDRLTARVVDRLSNVGSSTGAADRALGSSPTTDGANVIQLALTNSTGAALPSIGFSYTHRVLDLGNLGTGEAGELPGFTFFYSTDGTTWAAVPALDRTDTTLGAFDTGLQTINFGTPVLAGATVSFRWVDDNNDPSSPDAMQSLDNVAVAVPEPTTLSFLGLAALAMIRHRRA